MESNDNSWRLEDTRKQKKDARKQMEDAREQMEDAQKQQKDTRKQQKDTRKRKHEGITRSSRGGRHTQRTLGGQVRRFRVKKGQRKRLPAEPHAETLLLHVNQSFLRHKRDLTRSFGGY